MARRECPRRAGWRYLDPSEGYAPLAWLPKCGAVTCPVCIDTEVWKWGRIIGQASPSRYAVLTGLHETWQENRQGIRTLFQRLDRNGYQLRAFYCVEQNPKDTGKHLNIWWWGPDVPQQLLSDAAQAVGWGEVAYVKRWTSRSNDRYGLKEVTYGLKEARQSGDPQGTHVTGPALRYLENNGMRLMHARSGRNSPYRMGVGGDVYSTKRGFWQAMGEAQGIVRETREVLALWPNGEVVGSRDLLDIPPAWETPPEMTGRWERAAMGRSEWSWVRDPSGPSQDAWTLWQEEPA